jgi:hypothetical protein|tara:strand:- start:4290 stop:4805 length:516 start_codon:yes stop_codon:yes gene_type:complete
MKKIILISILSIVTISCKNENKYGYISIDDDKTEMIKKVFNSVSNEEITYLEEVFSSDLIFTNSDNEEFNKDEFIAGVKDIFDLFEDIKFDVDNMGDAEDSEIETNYYSNGLVWTAVWNNFSAKGKYSGKEISFPFHISYQWKGNKIIKEVQYFSTKVFDNEKIARENISK